MQRASDQAAQRVRLDAGSAERPARSAHRDSAGPSDAVKTASFAKASCSLSCASFMARSACGRSPSSIFSAMSQSWLTTLAMLSAYWSLARRQNALRMPR